MKKYIESIVNPYKGLPKEIYIMFISRMINSLGSFVYPLLTLILTQKIGLSRNKAGIFMTFIAVLSAPGMLIGGKLVDTIGRKKTILIFQTLALIVFVICAFLKPSFKMAYILMLAPVFYSFCMPAQDAITADLTDESNRKEAFSLLYMGHNLGFAIGPIIGGMLYKNHLPLVFLGDALTTSISLLLVLLFIKETLNREDEKVIDNKESSISILKKRKKLIFFALILFIYQFSYSQWGFLLPLQLGDIYGQDGGKYFGFMAGVNGVLIVCLTAFISRITTKLKSLKIIAIGGLFYSVAFLIFSMESSMVYFFIAVGIMTFGEVMVSVNTPVFISNNTPPSHRGRINAILPTIYGAGWALGPVLMGSFLSYYPIKVAWAAIFLLMFLAALFMMILNVQKDKSQ
ncbi:MAG: MFS transporter [Clostridiaceae bacterium]